MTDILHPAPMRAAGTNTRPAFAVPPGACDAHFHVFEPGYPPVPHPHYTFPDGSTDQYLALTEALGIERMVLVQPSFYGTDNSLLARTLKRLGPRCGGVVQIDENAADAELDAFHDIGVRAVRLDLFARADWPVGQIIAYIRRMAARVTPRGWHLQFYTPGTVVRDLLPFLADLEDTFVIDHLGYLTESDPDFERRLLAVLAQGSCWIKLSGAYRVAKEKPLSSSPPGPGPWSLPAPTGSSGARTGRTSPTASATPARSSTSWPTGPPPRRPDRQSWSTARPASSSPSDPRRRAAR